MRFVSVFVRLRYFDGKIKVVYDTGCMRHNRVSNLLLGLSAILFFVMGILWYLHGQKMRAIREAATVVRESFVIEKNNASTTKNFVVSSSVGQTVNLTSSLLGVSVVEKKTLSVPFASQAPELNWDEPWQDACEEAAIVMLQAYYGEYSLNISISKDMILKILDRESELVWGGSIEIEKIKKLAEEFVGKKFRVTKNPTPDDLRKYIREGKPILAVAYGKILPNPFFKNGGPEYHALIIRGFTADGFLTNDPGTRFGENLFYRDNELIESIHDWNDGDVAHGESVVMIVE